MSAPAHVDPDRSGTGFDIDAFARALGCYPTMTAIQAYLFGGRAGALFVDAWDEARDGLRPGYFAMHEDGPTLQVIDGQMGLEWWSDDAEQPTRTYWFPLPRTFDEAFDRLRRIDPQWWDESDREELRGEYRLECLKGLMRRIMKIPAHIH
jgi:hypothetical protein